MGVGYPFSIPTEGGWDAAQFLLACSSLCAAMELERRCLSFPLPTLRHLCLLSSPSKPGCSLPPPSHPNWPHRSIPIPIPTPILFSNPLPSSPQPFWPLGTGVARGFLAAFDAAWMVRRWAARTPPLEVLAER